MAFRKPSRQIEVFDISLMAVVTKAMGAFLVMMVLLMPYYTSNPDVQKTASNARDELKKAREQIADMAKRLGGTPDDAAALRRALAEADKALAEASQKIEDLSKQANALQSQLQRARQEAEDATAEANAAHTAQHAAQVAQAEMEAQANQTAQALRDNQVAQAEAEQSANQFAAALAVSGFTPKSALLMAWSPEAACASAPILIETVRQTPPGPPAGVNVAALGTLGAGLLDRSDQMDFRATIERTANGAIPHKLSIQTFWDSNWRAYVFAHSDQALPADCHIALTTTLIDLDTFKASALTQEQVTVPASGAPTMFAAVTDVGATHFPTPDAEDEKSWQARKIAYQRNSGKPGAAPAPAPPK